MNVRRGLLRAEAARLHALAAEARDGAAASGEVERVELLADADAYADAARALDTRAAHLTAAAPLAASP